MRARYYKPTIGRFAAEDTHWNVNNMIYGDNPQKINERLNPLGLNIYTYVPNIYAIQQSFNLYAYCMNNPLMYVDPSGNEAIFYQATRSKNWVFLMDDKRLNALVGVVGIIPFADSALWGGVHFLSGTKSISNNMFQEIATTLGASLGVSSFVSDTSKFAKAAGVISAAITVGNIGYELTSGNSYVNEITSKVFSGCYEHSSFDTTSKLFVAYAAITKDLVNKKIITYTTTWGSLKNYTINQEKYDKYFEDLGITKQEIRDMILY